MSALGDALAAQEEGLDPERLSRTYAALMAELQEAAGMGVHAVELTPATLAPVLPEGEEGDEKGNAHLAEPRGLLKSLPASLGQPGTLKQLTLAGLDGLEVLPDAVVTLTSLGSLTIQYCNKLRALPRGLGKLGAPKQLNLGGLDELQEMPDLIGLTALAA
jgi:hypothetical protein